MTQISFSTPQRYVLLMLASFLVLSSPGCEESKKIRSYNVKRIKAPQPETPPADSSAQSARMLAAILIHENQAWFFKVMGPDMSVATLREPFLQLVLSVKFGDDKLPAWNNPEGWQQQVGEKIAFADVIIPGSTGLKMTVTQLPLPEGDLDDYVLLNINRWRDQLGLEPTDLQALYYSEELKQHDAVLKIPRGDGNIMVVDLAGQASLGPGSRAPFMNSGSPTQPKPTQTPQEPKIAFEAPAGWEPAAPAQLSLLTFEVGDEAPKGSVTVSQFKKSDMLANINRWRGQVTLDPLTAEQLEEQGKKVKLGENLTAVVVEAIGPNAEDEKGAILGAIIETKESSWFVKLTSNAAVAEREKDNFQAFVQSLRLE